MAWKVELTPVAERELDRLDPQIARRILTFLHARVAALDDPRRIGEALKGSKLGDFWKYRVGDYRIISSIEDQTVRIFGGENCQSPRGLSLIATWLNA